MPPEQVCDDFQVDSHFFVQMENLHREQMWLTLEREFASMDRHFHSVTEEYAAFVKAIQPIYHQHGLSFPDKPPHQDADETVYRSRSVALNEFSEFVPHFGGPDQGGSGDVDPSPLRLPQGSTLKTLGGQNSKSDSYTSVSSKVRIIVILTIH